MGRCLRWTCGACASVLMGTLAHCGTAYKSAADDDVDGASDAGAFGPDASDAPEFDPGACGNGGTAPLIHYWPFDEDAGATARDCVGSFDGVVVGGVTWSTDSHRGSSVSVGTPDASYRFLRMGTALAESPPFTVTAWVKSSSARVVVASHGTDGYSGSVGWELDVESGAATFVIGIGDGKQVVAKAPLSAPNTWAFVAAAFDGATMRACDARTCIEKTLDGGSFAPALNHELRVGTGYRVSGTPALVDDVRLYARALTTSEIMVVATR